MATIGTMFPTARDEMLARVRAAKDAEYFAARAADARAKGERGRALRLAKKAKAARLEAQRPVIFEGIA
jgi:hypothetical protein